MGLLKFIFNVMDYVSTSIFLIIMVALLSTFVNDTIIAYGNNIDNFNFYNHVVEYRPDISKYFAYWNILRSFLSKFFSS
jgi:hypothetical protein